MKKIYYFIMMMITAAGIASCSDDDTPSLTSTVAPVLYEPEIEAFDESTPSVTFNWSNPRFYMDHETHATSVGSYEASGIKYNLQADIAGNNFANAVELGSIISKTFLTVTYKSLVNRLTGSEFGIEVDEDMEVPMNFRVVAQYGTVDSLSVVSNTITKSVMLHPVPVEPDGYVPYLDRADEISFFFETEEETDYFVWAWDDRADGSIFVNNGWPGDVMKLVGIAANGHRVYKFEFTKVTDIPTNFIVSKAGDVKIYDGIAFTNHGYYTEGSTIPEIVERIGPPSAGFEPYLESEDEHALFFETSEENAYYVWAWGDLGGGEAYCVNTSWPGDEMKFMGRSSSGKYVYKYKFVATTGIPSNFIISKDNGDTKIYDGLPYTLNGFYTEGSNDPTVVTRVGAPEYVPTISSPDEQSVFFETEGEYCRVWAWGGPGELTLLGTGDWGERPFLEKVGQTKSGKNVFKFVFGGVPDAFIITITDEAGEELSRPLDGQPYTKNGYYVDGQAYDGKVITKTE